MSRPPVIYSLPKVYHTTKPCVYRLSFDDKYIIVKCKSHDQSIKTIQKSLNQFMRGSEFQQQKDNLYFYFYDYIRNKQSGTFRIEILIEDDNAYELLKVEQMELDKGRYNKDCLSNSIEAYIPLFNELTGSYGWISKSAVMLFKKWLKIRNKQPR
jgi:hypothetical protein